ncbi:hypothetical protein QQS21_000923 [Conoideocrella luteorostrata]|uniref:CCHC-type domain-containing protein n=1 Tax=Conoideocrella luteorostrata TaxID=1105319 RepID=A0AAJ0D0C5_9HYPO|nr:hypothetical protein QQS21_000923 [Conoideocrella luteorostrata]
MASQIAPANRESFRVAIICALRCEFDAVSLLFDQFWDEDRDRYGRADGDTNAYTTGRIGEHHVVLALLPRIGTNSAAAGAASIRSSYTGLRLAILVGICGGVPRIADFDAFLGDVVVSKTVIQYDYGRQYPGHFDVKNTINDSLGVPTKEIRSMLEFFETELVRGRLQKQASQHLVHLQEAAKKHGRRANYQYPGTKEDKFVLCDSASKALCIETKCDSDSLVIRKCSYNLSKDGNFSPNIFIGRIGSGNTVMKSGEDRDRIAAEYDLIAFEMEGAGAWDEVPCIVVKGICDYADSHKNKIWQDFAAATAASVAKAILGRYAVRDGDRGPTQTNDKRHMNEHEVANNPFEGSARIDQGGAASLEENRPAVSAAKVADSQPARSQEKEEEGEQKWERIKMHRRNRETCLNCGWEGHWEHDCWKQCGKCKADPPP